MHSVMEQPDEQQIRQFLLGELSEGPRLELEGRLFGDDHYYKNILAIQEELADDYVQDNLTLSERSNFEQNFLRSSRRKERVEFAEALSRALVGSEVPVLVAPQAASWWKYVAAIFFAPNARLALGTSAAAGVLLVGVVWLAIENRRLSRHVEQSRQEQVSLANQTRTSETEASLRERELEAEIAALRAKGSEMQAKVDQKQRELESLRNARRVTRTDGSAGAFATFVLTPGLTRGTDEPEKLIISAATRSIQLQLDLEREENYQGYVAEIRTARGNLVWSRSGLKLQRTTYGQAVSLTIPSELLATGEYEIALKGAAQGKLEAISYYYIIALKK